MMRRVWRLECDCCQQSGPERDNEFMAELAGKIAGWLIRDKHPVLCARCASQKEDRLKATKDWQTGETI